MAFKKNKKVVIVGAGLVGMSYAYSVLNQGIVDELAIIDIDKDKVIGEVMDLNHGLAYTKKYVNIWAGDYKDCSDADIIVITAGVKRKALETRLDLINKNKSIIKDIVNEIKNTKFNGIILVASNPVDVMTYLVWKESKLSKNCVIGSGTSLDTARLKYEVSKYLNVKCENVDVYMLGEHGDSQFPAWSCGYVGKELIKDIINKNADIYKPEDLEDIFYRVKKSGSEIIKRKNSTNYGIGICLAQITRAIFDDSNYILPVSVYLDGSYGIEDVYLGLPARLNRNGVYNVVDLEIDEEEIERLKYSSKVLKEQIKNIE